MRIAQTARHSLLVGVGLAASRRPCSPSLGASSILPSLRLEEKVVHWLKKPDRLSLSYRNSARYWGFRREQARELPS